MKPDPAEQAIRNRMMPGELSRDGFLGHDDRPISAIADGDRAPLEAAGFSCASLAAILEEIHAAADAAAETTVSLWDGRVTACATEVRGRIPCPFGDGHLAHKAVIDISSPAGDLRVTPLGIHMLRAHCFLQGRGAPFRIEPESLIRLAMQTPHHHPRRDSHDGDEPR